MDYDPEEEPSFDTLPEFDEWIRFCFDQPVAEGVLIDSMDWCLPDPMQSAHYLARLFEDLPGATSGFSDAQVTQGIGFIVNISGLTSAARDVRVPVPLQVRWVRAILPLWHALFDSTTASPENLREEVLKGRDNLAFMFWDLGELYEAATCAWTPHLVDPVFEVLDAQLSFENEACRGGALHGLGHIIGQKTHVERAQTLIDNALASLQFPESLTDYAEDARTGQIA